MKKGRRNDAHSREQAAWSAHLIYLDDLEAALSGADFSLSNLTRLGADEKGGDGTGVGYDIGLSTRCVKAPDYYRLRFSRIQIFVGHGASVSHFSVVWERFQDFFLVLEADEREFAFFSWLRRRRRCRANCRLPPLFLQQITLPL